MDGKRKKYECEICGRLFILKGNYKVHILNHKSYGFFEDVNKILVQQIKETNKSFCWNQEWISAAHQDQDILQEFENVDNAEKDKILECPFCGKLHALDKVCLKTHKVKCKRTSSGTLGDKYSMSKSQGLNPELKSLVPEDGKFHVKSCDQISDFLSGTFSPTKNAQRLDERHDCNTFDYPAKGIERENTLALVAQVNVKAVLNEPVNEAQIHPSKLIQCDEPVSNKVFKGHVSLLDKNSFVGESSKQSDTCKDSLCKEKDICKFSSGCEYTCMLYCKIFVSNHMLKKHMELESHNCYKCSGFFHSCSALKNHLDSHPGFVCTNFRGTFSSEAMLTEHGKQKSHNCKVCNKMYFSCKHLYNHNKIHNTCKDELYKVDNILVDSIEHRGKIRHHCEVCEKNFESYEDFVIHERSYSSKVRCLTYNELFSSSSLLHKHVEQGSYKCNICKDSFSSCKDFKIHRKLHLKSRCSTCRKTFPSSEFLNEHLTKEFHICNICKMSFMSCKILLVHRNTHSKICCPVCRKTFMSEDLLVEHVAQESYTCEICDRGFTEWESLKAHMKDHKLRCKICKRQFLHLDSLKEHETKHLDGDLTCKYCQKKFKCLWNVKRHIERVHYVVKDVKCDICGKMFHKSVYRVHRRIHTGERPFQCVQCNATFVQKAHLTTHLKSYSGERNYQCNLCSKAFFSNQKLVLHQRWHTGEKPY